MSRLASILYLAGCIAAANAVSSVPIATQPVLSTSTLSTVSDVLSTSLSTILSTSTIVIYSTTTSRGEIISSSVGTQLSIFTSTSAIVTSTIETELSTIVETVGLTTLYSAAGSTSSSSSSTTSTSASVVPPPVAVTSQTPATTPVNIITSTAPVFSSVPTTSQAVTTTAASSSTGSPEKSSKKKLSSGAAAGIAIGAVVVIGGIAGAFAIFLGKRRQQKRWERKAADESLDGESKKNLFSPDAGAGYDSMWKKPAAVVTEKDTTPGMAMTSLGRVSPVSHERGDSSTLGADAPSIVSSIARSSGTPKTDQFGDRPAWKTVPNFSTPTLRTNSITALPRVNTPS